MIVFGPIGWRVLALLESDPEQLASKISGISPKMINEWQANAKALLSA